MNKKVLVRLGVAVGLAACATGGFSWWRSAVVRRTDGRALEEAQSAMKAGHAAEALATLDRAKPAAGAIPAWQDLEIRAAVAAMKVDRLLAIYERQPERIQADEEASLIIYRALAARGDAGPAAALAGIWQEKSTRKAPWLLGSADALMGNGKGPEARKLLLSQTGWAPADEAQRLMRLALLQAPADLEAAWLLLEQAGMLAPRNADIRSFKAQMLEATGRIPEARVEYVAALVAEPDNALRRDQLAEFYLRQGDFDHAVPTWLEVTAAHQAGFMEFKGRFWARVVDPTLDRTTSSPAAEPSSPWRAALDAMDLAPPGRWLAPAPADITPALTRHGEIWWLSLLDHIPSGDEAALAAALDAQPARAAAMAPDLSAALRTVLALRANRPPGGILWPATPAGGSRPSFFAALQQLTQAARASGPLPVDDPTLALARHPAALAWTFACAGWREAALTLHDWKPDPALPEPVRYTIAACTRLNRSPAAAVSFLTGSRGALLQGLAAECLITSGKVEEGLAALRTAAADDSEAGRRAGWLLATAQLEQRDLPAVTQTLETTPGLAATPTGMALAARLALATGQTGAASALYSQSAAAGSAEGQTWLLRQAVKSGDGTAAADASMKLRDLLPDQMETRANQLHLLPGQKK